MNSLSKFNKARSLDNLFDRSSLWQELTKNLFGDNMGLDFEENTATNIYETPEEYAIEYCKSGIPQDKWDVEIKDGKIFIKAENEQENEESDKDKKYYRRSFESIKINESYKIPTDVDSAKITAKYKDGILKVILPKIIPEESETTKIEIG